MNIFQCFFVHKFAIVNKNFWSDILKIENIKVIPVSFKNTVQMIMNTFISNKPFYSLTKSLNTLHFYTKFFKKNKSYKIIFLFFRFWLNIKHLKTIIFDIMIFWKNFSVATNKIYKFFKNSSKLNYFLVLNDTKRAIIKYTYLNFFHFDFRYLITNTVLIFYFKNSLDFHLFISFFKALLFENFFFDRRKRLINEKA